MRIISGKYKGRRISAPGNITARPTTDFAKEGLFNLLNNRIDFEGVRMLDLFAGTGGVGIEFVSRGAEAVVSVEQNELQCAFIRKVCQELKIENLTLMRTDVFKFLKSGFSKYDVIFADPPYDLPNLTEIPDLVFAAGILQPDGLFVLEHSSKNNFSEHPFFQEHRHYGNVNFTFFSYPDESDK